MTERKPPAVPFDRWVEQQIERGRRDGAFDDLPGRGQPIADLGRPRDENDWLAAMMRREQVDPSLFLPPSLTLPKELEGLRARLAAVPSERTVRDLVADLNQRIREAHRRPQEGPPLLVMSQDVEAVVATWHADRRRWRERYDAAHPPEPPPATAPRPRARRSRLRLFPHTRS